MFTTRKLNRKLTLAACAVLSAAALHVQAQEATPQTPQAAPALISEAPALISEPVSEPAATENADGFQKPLITLDTPDGRKAMLFANAENLPPLPEGYTREDIANGRVAYLSGLGPRTLIPNNVKAVITADGPYKVVASGAVNSRDPLIEIPYTHNRVFRLTRDHITRTPLFKKEVTFAKAGTLGFYAGIFKSGLGGASTMFCYFPVADTIKYASPSCGLGLAGHTELSFQPVATFGNLPTFYTVMTMNGVAMTNYVEGFASEITTDRIPYDFKLVVRFIKHTSKGVVIDWYSDGSSVSEEVLPVNAQGQAVLELAEGRLTLTPDAKKKKAATFAWTPKDAAAPPAS